VEIERVQEKLARPGFVEKAPAAVVEGERERLRRLRAELEALLARIGVPSTPSVICAHSSCSGCVSDWTECTA
jgi:hypothetical protein